MSTTTLTYPDVIRARHAPVLAPILMLTSSVLIVAAILIIVSSTTRDTNPLDRVPVLQNSIVPIPVPTPSTAEIQPLPSQTPASLSALASEPAVLPVAVPTPPLP